MTSQLSKNRPITRANTPRWSRIKALILGTSILITGTPGLGAEGSAAAPAATERAQTKTAAERWNRLKTQYDAPAVRPRQTPTQSATAGPPPQQAAQARPATPQTAPAPAAAPDAPSASAEVVSANVAEAAALKASEARAQAAEWRLPDSAEELAAIDQSIAATRLEVQTAATAELEIPAAPASTPAYEETELAQTPDQLAPPDSGTPRPLRAQIPAGPPRKTTQIRRMSDIAPLNDFNKETEIQKYAQEKAREFNVRFGGDAFTPREFPDVALQWAQPHSRYYPLYFQDPALERYGHTYPHLIQPIVSSARFSGQLVMMPYQMTIRPPWDLESPLGYYRPGDVVPRLKYPFPWNTKAALVQAASVTGFIYLIP